ncbi:MAG: ABC transporter substrate-binding protein [Verrucomicrobiae bacterium]|nr:ABC transporter substrate-binding protein [Verrucomicrobiae bacterium]
MFSDILCWLNTQAVMFASSALLMAVDTPSVRCDAGVIKTTVSDDVKLRTQAGVRIAVAGGAITEILYALGAEADVVAVDATSLYPGEALTTKKNLGYFRALSTEGVLSTTPTMIIASDKAGPPEVVKALKSTGVTFHEIDDRPTPDALVERVRAVARIVGKAAEGEALAASITTRFRSVADARMQIKAPLKKVLFVFSISGGRVVVGGGNSGAGAMIELAGGINAAAAVDGYKPVSEEALLGLAPDVIVFTSGRSQGAVRAQIEASAPMMATAAGRSRAFVEMDGLYLLGFGPRTPEAARDLMAGIYGPPAPPATR